METRKPRANLNVPSEAERTFNVVMISYNKTKTMNIPPSRRTARALHVRVCSMCWVCGFFFFFFK